MSTLENLIRMANQIARNLETQGPEAAAAATADHIRKFWAPRMRAAVQDHIEREVGRGLSEIALQAFRRIGSASEAGHDTPNA